MFFLADGSEKMFAIILLIIDNSSLYSAGWSSFIGSDHLVLFSSSDILS